MSGEKKKIVKIYVFCLLLTYQMFAFLRPKEINGISIARDLPSWKQKQYLISVISQWSEELLI